MVRHRSGISRSLAGMVVESGALKRLGSTAILAVSLLGCQFMPGKQSREMDYHRLTMAESEQALDASSQVVSDFSNLGYESVLKRGGKLKYEHDKRLPVMLLDDYRSFVKGVRLESPGDISSIVLRSFPTNHGLSDHGDRTILYPSFMLLDERFQVLEDIVRPKVNLTRSLLGKYGMSSSFTVPGNAKQAKYLVLYVAAYNRMGVYHYCEDGQGMVRFGSSNLPKYNGLECYAVPLSMEGSVELRLE